MKKLLLIFTAFFSLTLTAQEEDFWDEEDLFGDDSMEVIEAEDDSEEVADTSSFLVTEGVEFGGSFSASVSSSGSWADMPSVSNLKEGHNESFTPSVSGALHFNARPSSDIRFFGKVTTEYPFIDKQTDSNGDEYSVPNLKIYELYTDFNWDNKVFFKVGKQVAKWGVGYFYSPADFMSLETIDPENAEAEREGPLAVKIHIPAGLNNFYVYSKMPEDVESVSDLIWAPKAEFMAGDWEIGVGGLWQYDRAPRMMMTATGKISVFDLFAEGVALYGSDKNFIKEDYSVVTYDDQFFFKATAGFMWDRSFENILDIRVIGQYYFNGEGYSDDTYMKNIMYLLAVYNNAPDLLSPVEQVLASGFQDKLNINDFMDRSFHYATMMLSFSNIANNEDLGLSVLSMGNLQDLSFFVKPSVSYRFFDHVSASAGVTLTYGDDGDEFKGSDLAWNASVTLGAGSF